MALITITKLGSELHAQGDLAFVRRADPCVIAGEQGGHSLQAGWRWQAGSFEVFADRLGVLPLFYAFRDTRLYVSDSLAQLVAALPAAPWDLDALSVFLRIGFFVGDDTPFEGVKALAGGVQARITITAFRISGGAGLPPRKASAISRADARARYIELFRDAVRARLSDRRLGLPLSGGRDSRHILFELARSERTPEIAVTFSPYSGDAEYEIASRLCRQIGVPHLRVAGKPSFTIPPERDKNRRTHHLTDEHAWYLDVVAALKQQSVDIIFDGIGGDVLSNGLFYGEELLSAFQAGRAERVAEIVLGSSALSHLSSRLQQSLSWERARARIAREAKLHLDQPNPLASFFFWNRTCREIGLAPFSLAVDLQVAAPYVAPAVLDLLLSLPARDFGAPGFHDEAIRDAFPEYAYMPFASVKDKIAERRSRPGASEQLRYLSCCLSAAGAKLIDHGFVTTRLLRVFATQFVDRDQWWLQQLVYLVGLKELDRQSGLVGLAPR